MLRGLIGTIESITLNASLKTTRKGVLTDYEIPGHRQYRKWLIYAIRQENNKT